MLAVGQGACRNARLHRRRHAVGAADRATRPPIEKIEAEAAATPNGKGLLWKLEKPGEKPSFLFGTMHMTDPRVTTLPPAAQKAFDAAGTVIIETTDVLDQQKMMAAMLKEPDLMMFTDDTTLTSLLSPDGRGGRRTRRSTRAAFRRRASPR